MTGPSAGFTLGFVGFAADDTAASAVAYEDAVLPLLAHHGARLVYRGRRQADADPGLPLELHLIWFPDQAAFDAYLADPRRAALLEQFGDVFSAKHAVVLDTVEAGELP